MQSRLKGNSLFAFNLICKITEHLLLGDVISANYIDSSIDDFSSGIIYTIVKCKNLGFLAGICLEKSN
jgi:hypothetical protein